MRFYRTKRWLRTDKKCIEDIWTEMNSQRELAAHTRRQYTICAHEKGSLSWHINSWSRRGAGCDQEKRCWQFGTMARGYCKWLALHETGWRQTWWPIMNNITWRAELLYHKWLAVHKTAGWRQIRWPMMNNITWRVELLYHKWLASRLETDMMTSDEQYHMEGRASVSQMVGCTWDRHDDHMAWIIRSNMLYLVN